MLKAGTETGSLVNHILSASGQPKPEVGMGATILMWTDRWAATIVKVTPKQVHVRQDRATLTKGHWSTEIQEYKHEPDPDAPVLVFRMTKRGYRCNGWGLFVGNRRQYRDPSF